MFVWLKEGSSQTLYSILLTEKTILRIEGPKGSFFLRDDSDCPIIFIAGGTGFGPIKAIIEHLILMNSTELFTCTGVFALSKIFI